MARQPLPLGTWGSITTRRVSFDARGEVVRFEARAKFRDRDGRTRPVAAWGSTKTEAKNNLRVKLLARREAGGSMELKHTDRVTVAADLFFAELRKLADNDVVSPGTLETYQYQYNKNLEPRIGGLRLVEVTTPRVNEIVGQIRDEVGVATAKTCKSILTGICGTAVRHGALSDNPVREIKIARKERRKLPRAMDAVQLGQWFDLLEQDKRAVQADLVDLCKFMLATGERIGECLAVTWAELDFATGQVDCSFQIQRIKGKGLIRRRVKSEAGERVLGLPQFALDMLRARWTPGTSLDSPIFPTADGGFRDPHNVQKALRDARRPVGNERRLALGKELSRYRRAAGLTQTQVVAKLAWRKTRISLIETGRVRVQPSEVVALADLYKLPSRDRGHLLEQVELAGMTSIADELGWVTAHIFRKTTATILRGSGQTLEQVADQLGHAFTSTTADDYIGRRVRNPEAARHLDAVLKAISEPQREEPDSPGL